MIISLALLGYGASGTVLSLMRDRLQPRHAAAYVASIVMFAACALPAFLLAQHLAFSPEELLWRPSLAWRLAGLYLLLGTPFFFVGGAVGLAFMGWGRQANRVYALDLGGAAIGGVVVLGLLWVVEPARCLQAVVLLASVAVIVAALETRCGRRTSALFFLVAVAAITVVPKPTLQPSPYKDLSAALQVAGARVEATRSSPHGQVTVVSNRTIPFREAPGMGLTASAEPPEQLAFFVDGNFSSVVTRDSGDISDLQFLRFLPSAAPYFIATPQRVLVLDAGGGLLPLQARTLGAQEVVAVERNPNVVDLVRTDYADFSGRLYDGGPVRAIRADPRSFLMVDSGAWDLIQLPGAGSLGGGASGLFSLSEDYLRTREAIVLMLDRLAPDGILAVQVWLSLPPRSSLRLAATLIDAMKAGGFPSPGQSIVVLRSWQLAVIMVRRGQFTADDVEALRQFAARSGFDLVWFEGMAREQFGGIHRMAEPWLYDAVAAFVSGGGSEYAAAYKFDIRPTSDDRPFFNNFLRWRTMPEAIGLLRCGGMPLLEAGYVLLLATLLQAVLTGVLLILAPLASRGARRPFAEAPAVAGRTIVYFFALGLAFMLIELAAIHRFILFLEEPIFASAVVVSAFLVFAGVGSLVGGRLATRMTRRRLARTAALAVVVLGAGWLLLLGPVTAYAGTLSMGMKILVTLILIAPLAFAMGQPFPAAVAALSETVSALVPWAWAVNGCASVIGAVLATVLAMAVGFDGCLTVALAMYLLAFSSCPSSAAQAEPVR